MLRRKALFEPGEDGLHAEHRHLSPLAPILASASPVAAVSTELDSVPSWDGFGGMFGWARGSKTFFLELNNVHQRFQNLYSKFHLYQACIQLDAIDFLDLSLCVASFASKSSAGIRHLNYRKSLDGRKHLLQRCFATEVGIKTE